MRTVALVFAAAIAFGCHSDECVGAPGRRATPIDLSAWTPEVRELPPNVAHGWGRGILVVRPSEADRRGGCRRCEDGRARYWLREPHLARPARQDDHRLGVRNLAQVWSKDANKCLRCGSRRPMLAAITDRPIITRPLAPFGLPTEPPPSHCRSHFRVSRRRPPQCRSPASDCGGPLRCAKACAPHLARSATAPASVGSSASVCNWGSP